jgi:hypothetical protein
MPFTCTRLPFSKGRHSPPAVWIALRTTAFKNLISVASKGREQSESFREAAGRKSGTSLGCMTESTA